MRKVLLVFGLLFAVAPASAQAASLIVDYGPSLTAPSTVYIHVMDGGQGEKNTMLITPDGTDLLVEDSSAEVSPSTSQPGQQPCTLSTDRHTARCPLLGARRFGIRVEAGGGDDTIDVRTWLPDTAYVDGGPGNDTITTDGGMFIGGPGDDVLTARSLTSNFDGGAGGERITGSPQPDFIAAGAGNDTVAGGDGADTMYDGDPATSSDDGNDTLDGGPAADLIYARGGVDAVRGGEGDDLLFVADALTASGSPTQDAADSIDCGGGTDAGLFDAADVLAGCETAYIGCANVTGPPWTLPTGPCPLVAPKPAEPTPPPAPAPTPTPTPTPVKPALPRLTARLRLTPSKVRPPLRAVPRGLVTLSAIANVRITAGRVSAARTIPLAGTVERRLGKGERNISLVTILGGRQTFVPGRYRLTLTATTADGRTATTTALLRILTPHRR